MAVVGPLDERRQHAPGGKRSVSRHGDPPFEATPRHRLNRAWDHAKGPSRGVDVVRARDPVNQPGQGRLKGDRVEGEPARPARRARLRIDGDDFDIALRTEADEAVVGAHQGVLAAALRAHPKPLLEIGLALLERCRRDDQMVEGGGRHQAWGDSSAAKSSSTRAPFGSKKKTCHSPEPTCLRQTCSTLCAVKVCSVVASPRAEKAMWSITPGRSTSGGRPPTICRIAWPSA